MSIQGIGALSRFGVETETVPGTPDGTSPTVYWPITSESVNAGRNTVPSGSIVGDSMIEAVADGLISLDGGVQMEFDGSACGHPIWYWNGNNGYTSGSIAGAASHSYVTTLPTLAQTTGGSLALGTYFFKVSTVLQRTADSKLLIMPASAEATITLISPNGTATVAWTNPSPTNVATDLPGHTLYGTLISRTALAGATGTEYYVGFVSGTTATYMDDGTSATESIIVTTQKPYSATIYNHDMIGTPYVSGDRLKSFTYYGDKNNGEAEQYSYAMMDGMKIAVGGMGEKVMLDFTIKATSVNIVSSFVPSFVPVAPFVGWQALASIDGSPDTTLENFSIDCSNGVVPVPGIKMTPFNRGVISGRRSVSVTFSRQFQDRTFWNRMIAGTPFSLKIQMYGQPIVSASIYGVTAAQSGLSLDMVPFTYYSVIDIYNLKANKAGASVSGPDRLVEQITASTWKDATNLTEMRINMWNTIAAYV